ncbi:MAG: ABC transporter ATP-binding protein [Xanthomonadaceae bacterium]|nr:ABC transporter ATP-binding protein [Xanthomonadaceae bacterium]
MQPLLEVRNLVKTYPNVQAVRGVSFKIPRGICFGLLGPNGAGKTTTLEMIEGITLPTSGEIDFQGKPSDSDFKKSCGIQFQSTALPDYLTVREVLDMFGSMYSKTADVQGLIEWTAIGDFLDRDVHKLSGGQRQRVLLAVALINDPELIFLDEPTTGLDPQARRNFWELILSIKAKGKTIVLTTHYMEEAYTLCDEIAIMDQGKIRLQGAPQKLLREVFDSALIQIPKQDFVLKNPSDFSWPKHEQGDEIEIESKDVNQTIQDLIHQGVSLKNMRTRSHTLDDLFLQLTGKGLRDA